MEKTGEKDENTVVTIEFLNQEGNKPSGNNSLTFKNLKAPRQFISILLLTFLSFSTLVALLKNIYENNGDDKYFLSDTGLGRLSGQDNYTMYVNNTFKVLVL